eukprot:238047-Pleurochrysis_carterae.AAC.2
MLGHCAATGRRRRDNFGICLTQAEVTVRRPLRLALRLWQDLRTQRSSLGWRSGTLRRCHVWESARTRVGKRTLSKMRIGCAHARTPRRVARGSGRAGGWEWEGKSERERQCEWEGGLKSGEQRGRGEEEEEGTGVGEVGTMNEGELGRDFQTGSGRKKNSEGAVARVGRGIDTRDACSTTQMCSTAHANADLGRLVVRRPSTFGRARLAPSVDGVERAPRRLRSRLGTRLRTQPRRLRRDARSAELNRRLLRDRATATAAVSAISAARVMIPVSPELSIMTAALTQADSANGVARRLAHITLTSPNAFSLGARDAQSKPMGRVRGSDSVANSAVRNVSHEASLVSHLMALNSTSAATAAAATVVTRAFSSSSPFTLHGEGRFTLYCADASEAPCASDAEPSPRHERREAPPPPLAPLPPPPPPPPPLAAPSRAVLTSAALPSAALPSSTAPPLSRSAFARTSGADSLPPRATRRGDGEAACADVPLPMLRSRACACSFAESMVCGRKKSHKWVNISKFTKAAHFANHQMGKSMANTQ